MRYKNLTITLTLGCLSIVALAGLVMLPISDGVCELTVKGWKYSDDNTSASYGAYQDDENWELTSYIDAKSINASVSVSAWPPEAWTKTERKDGKGHVMVHRRGYNFQHKYFSVASTDCSSWQLFGGCRGHQRDPKTLSNEPNHEHFNGEPDDLILKVDVTEVTRVDIVAKSLSTSDTFDLTVGAGDDRAELGFKWTHGSVKVKTVTVSEAYTVTIGKTAIARGVAVSLDFDRYAYSAALASFDFDEDEVTGFGSVTYTPDPDILD